MNDYMPKAKLFGTRNIWACNKCGMVYKEIVVAQDCEDFCTKNGKRSEEIVKKAFQGNRI